MIVLIIIFIIVTCLIIDKVREGFEFIEQVILVVILLAMDIVTITLYFQLGFEGKGWI